jgi:hypothetical protein
MLKKISYTFKPPICLHFQNGDDRRYDTFVPVMFAGAGLEPGTVSRPVTPYDVAPTLANVRGVKPPSGSIGPLRPPVIS